jgi:putative transposase
MTADRWRIGRYVLLQDHLHVFCAPSCFPPESLRLWVRYWKRLTTQALNDAAPRWQSDQWDTQLRIGESYQAKWEYIRANPVRHGFVNDAGEWPYQGEIHQLYWYEP